MSFESWRAFSFFLDLASSASQSGASLDAKDCIYYCKGCLTQRGYRAPLDGIVNTIVDICAACGSRELVFNIEDMLRADQPDEP